MAKWPKNTNRLINEKSPYLLQHAHNPVDWFAWGDEAFQTARKSDKPIFLSVGYATCHWCHVMEKESFEDAEVAALMNNTFVCIKVDREELPEVDALYMEFAQSMMSGAAGWPLNVILTPELQPFFAVTYLPPRPREGMMGLTDLIDRIDEVWNSSERQRVIAQAEKIVEVFSETVHTRGENLPDETIVDEAVELLYKMADPVYGGLKGAPKFPIAYQTNLLMLYSALKGDNRAIFIAERTLDMMQRGGIYDHLGGGFSRYSIDEMWLVPHFEKMLYDNALLCHSYLEAWKITGRDFYKNVTEEIISYVLRDLTCPEGGFFSAEDADSEGKEGTFYTWTYEEINQILDGEEARLFCEYFDVTEQGNFEGRNILHTTERSEQFSLKLGIPIYEFETKIKELKQQVWAARCQRERPLKDDKIITSWNGLMIHSLVEAGAAFKSLDYLNQGVQTAGFIKDNLWKNGTLFRRWREGEVKFNAGLEDYSYLIRSLISLFEVGCGNLWLEWALELTDILNDRFKSREGGFYQTDGTDPNLIIRNCQFSDGAEPSGNAIHCENLLRLFQLTNEPRYLEGAGDILMAVNRYLHAYSPGYCYHVINLFRFYNRLAPTIVVALNDQREFYDEIYEKIFRKCIPHRAVIWRENNDDRLFKLIPFSKEQVPVDGRTTVYICHDRVCKKPLNDIKEILEAIEKL